MIKNFSKSSLLDYMEGIVLNFFNFFFTLV